MLAALHAGMTKNTQWQTEELTTIDVTNLEHVTGGAGFMDMIGKFMPMVEKFIPMISGMMKGGGGGGGGGGEG